ncbi:MAG: hypothetical protein IT162_23305 [Bryobacterales bacterium]|nr:hypothetical protein [Bryobacterales bacterium]
MLRISTGPWLQPLLLLLSAAAVGGAVARAQTLEDGIMMGKGLLCGGYMYSNDRWDQYWEGTLKRSNGNIGTLTTQSHQIFGNYGLTDRLNLIVHLPHVRTEASQGVLAGMRGWQDATVAAKWKFLDKPVTEHGSLRLIGGLGASLPVSNYTPDFLPLSIGLGSRRLTGRLTAHFRGKGGWFVNAHSAYTWRDGVKLDRPFFYTDGRLTFSDRVRMPSVFDYALSSGYIRRELVLSAGFSQQYTLGGGDIRRQDMPFVSNRMNASRVNLWAKIPLPRHDDLSFVAGYSYVLSGRNVGQSTTLTAGVMYLVHFPWSR